MSKYYCFGDCGCKYETLTKENILKAINENRPIVYNETATVIGAAGEKVIQLSNDLFTTHCFIEIYANGGNAREYLGMNIKVNATRVVQNFVIIPLETNTSNEGDMINLIIKITPLNDNYDGETQVYVHL